MSARHPISHYANTPSNSDGELTASLADAVTIFGFVSVHDESIDVVVDADEAVSPEDVLGIDEGGGTEAQYRVVAIHRLPGIKTQKLICERVSRPVHP
jgi:hypothetical protein